MDRKTYVKNRKDNLRALKSAYKLEKGCEVCGYKENANALEFDHIDPSTKRYNVSKMRNNSIDTVMKEIAKCRILCANCHRIKTLREKDHIKDES